METRDGGRAVRSYLGGAAAARVGDEMAAPALLLAGLAATGSASRAAAVPAALMASAAAGGPLFGMLLDRSARPGRLLAAALGGYAAALALLLATLDRLPLGVTVLLAVLAGPLGPALSGGWTSQLPRVVTAGRLARANALDAMTYDLASLAGPALAGVVSGLSGAPVAVAAAAALICLALPSAWTLPSACAPPSASARPHVPGAAARAVTRHRPRVPIRADLAAGFRAIHRSPALARATTASVVSCVGDGMFITCAPLLGAAALGGAGARRLPPVRRRRVRTGRQHRARPPSARPAPGHRAVVRHPPGRRGAPPRRGGAAVGPRRRRGPRRCGSRPPAHRAVRDPSP